jgi:hypothetical protein
MCVIVQVVLYPDAGTSLLLFSWDHMLFDYQTAFKILRVWLSTAAAVAAGDVTAVAAASCMLAKPCFSRKCYQQCAAGVAAAPGPHPCERQCSGQQCEQNWTEQPPERPPPPPPPQQQQQQELAWSIPVARHDFLEWLRQASPAIRSSQVRELCQAIDLQQLSLLQL